MKKRNRSKVSTVDYIKGQIKLLNGAVLLSVVVVFVLVVKFLYDMCCYLPMASILGMLAIIAFLSVVGMTLTKKIAGKAINAIEGYSSRLSSLLFASQDIQKVEHTDVLLEKFMDRVMELSRSESAVLVQMEEGKPLIRLARCRDVVPDGVPVIPVLYGKAIDYSYGNGQVFISKDAERWWSDDPESADAGQEGLVEICVVPVSGIEGKPTILQLARKGKGVYSLEDVCTVKYFAAQAVMAFENLRFKEDKRNYEIHVTNTLVAAMENHVDKHGHSRNVTNYALLIADEIGMEEERRKTLYSAAMLHDIGALMLSEEDMNGEGYRMHPQLGYELLRPINFYSEVANIILHHHERYDGKGYPYGISGESIPLESKIIAIAEAFDALMSDSSFDRPMSIEWQAVPTATDRYNALIILKNDAGTKFDPELVDAFIDKVQAGELCERSCWHRSIEEYSIVASHSRESPVYL